MRRSMETKVDNSQHAAAGFLRTLKGLVAGARGLSLIRTAKNTAALIDLGLNEKAVESVILGLTVTDYCAGPEPDETRPGEVWFFGTELSGSEIYIKLKIAAFGPTKIATCLSFHKAERPLRYPLRE